MGIFLITSTRKKPVTKLSKINLLEKVPQREDYAEQVKKNSSYRNEMYVKQCKIWEGGSNFNENHTMHSLCIMVHHAKHKDISRSSTDAEKYRKQFAWDEHRYYQFVRLRSVDSLKNYFYNIYMWSSDLPSLPISRNPLILDKMTEKVSFYRSIDDLNSILRLNVVFLKFCKDQCKESRKFLASELGIDIFQTYCSLTAYQPQEGFIQSLRWYLDELRKSKLSYLKLSGNLFIPEDEIDRRTVSNKYFFVSQEENLQIFSQEDEASLMTGEVPCYDDDGNDISLSSLKGYISDEL
jgi:hypothetical protein